MKTIYKVYSPVIENKNGEQVLIKKEFSIYINKNSAYEYKTNLEKLFKDVILEAVKAKGPIY